MDIASLGALDSMMRYPQMAQRSQGPLDAKAKQGPLERVDPQVGKGPLEIQAEQGPLEQVDPQVGKGPLELQAEQGPLDRASENEQFVPREGEEGYLSDVRQLASV